MQNIPSSPLGERRGGPQRGSGPRGLRNCNPLNIRRTGAFWQGMASEQTDPEFVQFRSMAWGYRAAFCVLRTYRTRYGADTPKAIVSRWAPPHENHTDIYLRMVCVLSELPEDHHFRSDDDPDYMLLVSAMSRIENGVPADMFDVARGWSLYVG